MEHVGEISRLPSHAYSLEPGLGGREVGSDADGSYDSDDYRGYEPSRLNGELPGGRTSPQFEGELVARRGVERSEDERDRFVAAERDGGGLFVSDRGVAQANKRNSTLSEQRWNGAMVEGIFTDGNTDGGFSRRPFNSLNALRVDVEEDSGIRSGATANGALHREAVVDRRYPGEFFQLKREPIGAPGEPVEPDFNRELKNEWNVSVKQNGHGCYAPYEMKPPLLRLQSSIPMEQNSVELSNPDELSPAFADSKYARVSSEPQPTGSGQFAMPQYSPALSAHSENGGVSGGGGIVYDRRALNGFRVAAQRRESLNDFSPNRIPTSGAKVGAPAMFRRAPSSGDLALSPVSDAASVRRCRYQSGSSQEAIDRERLLYQDEHALFRCLTASFRELDDIMKRVGGPQCHLWPQVLTL